MTTEEKLKKVFLSLNIVIIIISIVGITELYYLGVVGFFLCLWWLIFHE